MPEPGEIVDNRIQGVRMDIRHTAEGSLFSPKPSYNEKNDKGGKCICGVQNVQARWR